MVRLAIGSTNENRNNKPQHENATNEPNFVRVLMDKFFFEDLCA